MIAILKRAYFSPYHLFSANNFLDRASSIEFKHTGKDRFDFNHNSYVISSIISSVAFLEAAINELFQDVYDDHESYTSLIDNDVKKTMKKVWQMLERRPVLEKYQLALELSNVKAFSKGRNPYSSTNLAILLRNELVHYKPKTFGAGKVHSFANKLKGKFELNPLMSNPSNQFFPDQCLSKGCAEWVLISCLSLTEEFFSRMQVTPTYQRLDEIDIQTLKEKLLIG